MLNFRKWLESFVDHEPTTKDALDVFFKPQNTISELSAASIIDSEITKSHVPFIYLTEYDDLYEGFGNDYHENIIEKQEDMNLSFKLTYAYDCIGVASSDAWRCKKNAVGRIGYRIDFDKIKGYLPRENLLLLMQGEESGDQIEKNKRFKDFNMKFSAPASPNLKRIFSSIDLIAIYSENCTIEIAARTVQLLDEKNSINDLNKTIVIYDDKPYLASDFVSYAKKPEPLTPVAPEKPVSIISKEKTPIYGKDFKPQTWKQALRQIGVEPTIGDSILHKGKKYHG